jgi:hypothetical protein
MMMLTLGTWFVGAVLLAILWTAYEGTRELIGIRSALELRNHVKTASHDWHDVNRDQGFAHAEPDCGPGALFHDNLQAELERRNREFAGCMYGDKPDYGAAGFKRTPATDRLRDELAEPSTAFQGWEDRPVSFAPVRGFADPTRYTGGLRLKEDHDTLYETPKRPERDPIAVLNELAAPVPYRFGSKPVDPVEAAKVEYDHVLWPDDPVQSRVQATPNYDDAYPRTLYGTVYGG